MALPFQVSPSAPPHLIEANDNAAVAIDSTGNFVIAWDRNRFIGGKYTEVFARQYSPTGRPGSVFRVNIANLPDDHEFGWQENPTVALHDSGDLVIAYQDKPNSPDFDIKKRNYRLQSGATLPTPVDPTPVVVNSHISGDQKNPSAAMDPLGKFIITWQSQPEMDSNPSLPQDGSGSGVYAQHFNALGQRSGVEFRVNTHTVGDQSTPAIAVDSAGRYTVAWTSFDPNDGDGNGVPDQDGDLSGVYMQRFFDVDTGRPFIANGDRAEYELRLQNFIAVAEMVAQSSAIQSNVLIGTDIWNDRIALPVSSDHRTGTHDTSTASDEPSERQANLADLIISAWRLCRCFEAMDEFSETVPGEMN
jgi:hypothetical protein